jgi:hypothetical protein
MLDHQELVNSRHCHKQRTHHVLTTKSLKILTSAFLIWQSSPRKILCLVMYACGVTLYWIEFLSAPAARCFAFYCSCPKAALHQLLTSHFLQAAVHLDCYQSPQYPTGPWRCELCQEIPLDTVLSGKQSDCNGLKACSVQCGLCYGTSGAFRKTMKGQWVHAFCAEVLIYLFFFVPLFSLAYLLA